MPYLSDWIPTFFSPTFEQFTLAAQNTTDDEAIIYREGLLSRINKKEAYRKDLKEANQRTWRAFTSSIENSFSREKIKQICKRYNNIQWEELKNSTLPLDKIYIEYFGVGAGTIHVFDLQNMMDHNSYWFRWDIRNRSAEEVRRHSERASALQFLGAIKDPRTMFGSPEAEHEHASDDAFSRDKQRCHLLNGITELDSKDPNIPPLHPFYSRLEMAVICLLDTKDIGMVIPGPRGDLEVYDIISSNGLTAIALKPVSKHSLQPPIIAFRCTNQALTQTNAIPSLLNDFERHIGKSGYEACRPKLESWQKDARFLNRRKPTVLGYSLGGGHASRFFHEFWRSIGEFVIFNSVGIDAEIVDELANQINGVSENEVPPPIYLHRNVSNKEGTIGDWVNKLGEKHMGWGIRHKNSRVNVFEWLIDDYPVPGDDPFNPENVIKSFDIHAVRPMDSVRNYSFTLHQGGTACDRILDTYNRDRSLEDMRQSFGRLYYNVIKEIYQILDLIFRVIGLEFFKKHR